VAPVPWFPFTGQAFGSYGRLAQTPRREERNGLDVHHPRYLMIPKIGMRLQPHTLAACGLGAARRLLGAGYGFDVIDAHYLYPDAVAASRVAAVLGKPFVATARGSDVNLIAQQYPAARRQILSALRTAYRVITVSSALREALLGLGLASEHVTVLRNGVDLELFKPIAAEQARRELGLGSGPLVASVGNLVPGKGHDIVIEAATLLPEVTVLVVGDGGQRVSLTRLADRLGVAGRVRFLGSVPQARLRAVYSAADALALASAREGWPNVLLEAMACGTPVVATNVGGIPEIVTKPEVGRVVRDRSGAAFAEALRSILERVGSREAVRTYAEQFSWDATTRGQLEILSAAAQSASPPPTPGRTADDGRGVRLPSTPVDHAQR
jgi:glycosyltransferase involved in cell wall biosynthesis